VKNFESLRVPKYVQLMIRLRDQIEEGNLKPGEPLPTREKLMQEYGLSLSTVTRAITELERQGWLISRQGSGTFVTKHSNDTPESSDDLPTVGLLLPMKKPISTELVNEIVNEAMDQNINIITMFSPNDEDTELNFGRILMEKEVKAMIWFPVEPKKHVSVASLFGKNRIPVIIGEKVSDQISSPWSCVRSDYYIGTQSAIQYLIENGHSRIAYVGPRGNTSDFGPVSERWNAYKNTMKARDLWEPDQLVMDPSLFKEWHVNANRIDSIFKGKNSPTAVIGFDEVISLEVIRGLNAVNIDVPDQVSVIGHGDGSCGCYSNPRLSTVSPCLSEYVDSLIHTLKSELSHTYGSGEALEQREIVVPQRLLLRDSTAAAERLMRA
jgi:GntR family transcriptional regulator, arabinose operon transcriptional repressor